MIQRDEALLYLVTAPLGMVAAITGTWCWGRILGWW